jgi:ribosome biogenesis GTPase / thiamine phosphate phosphatase
MAFAARPRVLLSATKATPGRATRGRVLQKRVLVIETLKLGRGGGSYETPEHPPGPRALVSLTSTHRPTATMGNRMSFDLSSLGWDDAFASAYARYADTHCDPARVTRVDRGVCTVMSTSGPRRASTGGGLLAAAFADPRRLPCTGDWVVVRRWPDARTTIEAVLPRRTTIIRSAAGTATVGQVLAANINTVAVVEPLDPEPDVGRIERLLAVAWQSGAQPLVILTKADLAADPQILATEIAQLAPGVQVYAISAVRVCDVAVLDQFVRPGATLALLGTSGAGKSTLVNTLAGATVMTTQGLRRGDGRGRHTTTFRSLVIVPGGGAVLDTPGIRAVGLFDGIGGLEQAFIDIESLAQLCRFRDCSHGREPGCAVTAALATGDVSARRLSSWRRLRREIALEVRRHDARLSAASRRRAVKQRKHRGRGSES